jgi:hypothetical protein
LGMAEDEGRARGCRSGALYTISFSFGEIACDPPGTSRIFMTKELA